MKIECPVCHGSGEIDSDSRPGEPNPIRRGPTVTTSDIELCVCPNPSTPHSLSYHYFEEDHGGPR